MDVAVGRFGLCYGPFWLYDGPFWTMFLEIKIFGAVLVGAVLAMGRFGIDPIISTLLNKFLCHCKKYCLITDWTNNYTVA